MFFANSAKMAKNDGVARLKAYADAGHAIANHTHSHPRLNDVGAESFVADMIRGHDALSVLPGFVPFFRYPYSKEGSDKEMQKTVRTAIEALGYKQGYFTVDSADWYWAAALGQAKDEAARATIVDLFVRATIEAVLHYDAVARRVLGRQPRHVLVLHETDLNALAVGAMIRALKERGWKIIPAVEAFADPLATKVPAGLKTQYRISGLAAEAGLPPRRACPSRSTRSGKRPRGLTICSRLTA
jgi:peptidoglycan/xylan/chitin deacetylase (PgdA/CDA1 family)